ncbi:eCIS core domain-containing protein, partial [Streptomyces broussonetiae]
AQTAAALQRTVGNAAVTRMIEEQRGDPGRDHEPAVQRSAVHGVLRSPGRPLDEPLRAEMETRLGADFSDVRIHTGGTARASATEVGARAYTSGNHIVIGDGGADKHTLAHELTHVIQQRQGPVAGTDNGSGLRISDPADRFEREAEANATRVMQRRTASAGETRAETGEAHETARGASGSEVVQRYTTVEDQSLGQIHVSESGRYAIDPQGQHVWVRDDVPAGDLATALRAAGQQAQIGGRTYNQYWLGGPILLDCLHAAEEIINNQVGQLDWGEGEYSTIDIRSRGSVRTEAFGKSDSSNRRQARSFAGARNEAADPQPGEAFVIVATKPDGTEMSQFHAAAVVARDGQDCITLEVWSDNGNPPARQAAIAAIYTVADMQRSFHTAYGGEDAYFGEVGPITVVVRRMGT